MGVSLNASALSLSKWLKQTSSCVTVMMLTAHRAHVQCAQLHMQLCIIHKYLCISYDINAYTNNCLQSLSFTDNLPLRFLVFVFLFFFGPLRFFPLRYPFPTLCYFLCLIVFITLIHPDFFNYIHFYCIILQ